MNIHFSHLFKLPLGWLRKLALLFGLMLVICFLLTITTTVLAQKKDERNAAVMEITGANQPTNGKRVALVIGNSAYKNTSKLANPVNDADDLSAALKGFGFEVISLKNGTRRQMNEKLAEFSQKIDGASAALVYYAGHGAQIRGANYLMPVDASVDTEAAIIDESISLNRVLEELEGGRNRTNIVMLDACRDNPITGKFRSAQRGLSAPSFTPKGTVIVYATDPGNTAADGDGRNGTFTAGLLKAFKGNDLSLDGVLTVASEEVERQSNRKQTPYVNGPKTVQKNFHFRVTVNPSPVMLESEYWASIKESKDVADFEAYLADYPKGQFKRLAENRINVLKTVTASITVPVASAPTAQPATIIREEIKTQSVKGKVIEPGYAWVRLTQFQDRTVEDFVKKIEEVYKADPNLKGLVLDLRNDHGGLLNAAVAISAAFLPENVEVVSTNGQLAESKFSYKASPEFYAGRMGGDPLKSLPAALRKVHLVVLVNEGSSSASEIVAGALQDHKRAVIMGSQSFGKGSVQTVRPLEPDTGVKITTVRYYTPSGKSIQAEGIIPNVMLDETAEGSPFAALRTREVDPKKKAALVKEREIALKKLEEENKKPPAERKLPEYGSDKDFQLRQALNQLKGLPVFVSKT